MNFVNILVLCVCMLTAAVECGNATADDYSYDDGDAAVTTTRAADYDEDSSYDYDDEQQHKSGGGEEEEPYKCPGVCVCRFHRIEDAAATTTTTTTTAASDTEHEAADDYDYDYSTKDSYEIEVDCANRTLSNLNGLFDDEFPVESIVKLNLSSNAFETLKFGDFELFQSLKSLDLSSNSKLRTLPSVNLLKNFQELTELHLNDLQLATSFCSNCKSVRRHFGYFNKTGIQVSLKNVRCGSGDDSTLDACFQQEQEIMKMEPKQDLIIFEGDPMNLKCRVNAPNNTTISWSLNNTAVLTGGVQIRQNSSYSELNVAALNARRHTGVWRCTSVLSGDHKVKAEIFVQVLVTNRPQDDTVYCPDLITVTSKGAFKWNKTSELNSTAEQRCLVNSDQVATYECRLRSDDNKTAIWSSLNVSQCEFESNLTRYLSSLLRNSSNLNLNFKLNMTKSNIVDYQLIIQLIQAKFRLESKSSLQLGKFLVDFYNFLANQTLDVTSFADFNQFEFNLSLRAFFQMLNFYIFSFHSRLDTQYLVIDQPVIVYRPSNLLTYYLAGIPVCSAIISVDSSNGLQNRTLEFEMNTAQQSSAFDYDLAVLMTKFNWKKIRLFNYKDRFKDNMANYDLMFTLASPTLQHWQPYTTNTSQFSCEFTYLTKNQSFLYTKCQFKAKQRVNLVLKWSNSTQNELKFYYFNEKFIYFSSISSFVFMLVNVVAYIVNNKQILMPDKFKHCLVNIWSCQLIQILLNLLLLIQIDLKPLCIINSLLEHAFILSTFLWYLIYTVELYKKLLKLHEGNLNPTTQINTVPQHDDEDDATESGDDETPKKHKPIVHLYMIALALPVFLCLISYTSTPKYVNFEYSYCFLTQLDILLITFMLPIGICLVLIVVFSVLILRVHALIIRNLEEAEEEVKSAGAVDDGVDTKYSNQYSVDSIMDTQYRPRVQLAFIWITLTIYILMEVCLQLEIYKSKFKLIDQLDSLFVYCYSLLLLVYSIITFSFYFLTRNDTFKNVELFRKNYYFEQEKVAYDIDSSSSLSSEERKKAEECETPNNSQESAGVEVGVDVVEETTAAGVATQSTSSPSSIHYIDETTAAATASNYSFGDQQQPKRKTHVRNGSILSGQFSVEQQLAINSIEAATTAAQPPVNNTMSRRGTPIYVYVDHNYEDKLFHKIKSPVAGEQQPEEGVWLNKFFESDKPFKHETSV